MADSYDDGVEKAREIIESGKAYDKLMEVVKESNAIARA